ncbi:lipid-A-disaccharide synthase [Chamaesiphon sp. VAR_69_metabat_338]|uniref:lipid-A-disaccharide synthase n=1 Tax=Chamaesiphon sp. VAR_69_metabat_338 TaxID=2964704 RepID=UPI00286DFCF9|nr:lipid-A-disaccharide synthase [Chamaesiphon sp. VAR_69_metabat_338]
MNTIQPIDLIILSNGSGEVTTWVRPVVKALRAKLGIDRSQIRISAILSPCPNASGKEVQILQSYPEIDRVQDAEHFTNFLVWGKTAENWDWRSHGIIIFLGGDQFFPVIIGKRLGYQTVVYAEWTARWHNLIDRFAVMNAEVTAKVKPQYADKFTVVGDLMVEMQTEIESEVINDNDEILIGLLPGSKSAKLGMGLPLMLAIAQYIQAAHPQVKFAIPVAPTIDLDTLASYADPTKNPVIALVNGATATLVRDETMPYLQTNKGLKVALHTEFPAYDWLSKCTFCLTTIGANTAELGGLGIPMIVLIALQQLDAMRAWDGGLGILVNLPLIGSPISKLVNTIAYRTMGSRKFAWPNIWAGGVEIVPELVGNLDAKTVAEFAIDYLEHPEKLAAMRSALRRVRGEAGAADKLASIVADLISSRS